MTKTLNTPPARKIARMLERAVAKAVGATASSRPAMPLAARLSDIDRAAAATVLDPPKAATSHRVSLH